MSEQREILKFAPNLPAKVVTFEYDSGKKRESRTVTKKDGTTFVSKPDYMWGCTYNGKKCLIFASEYLNDKITEQVKTSKTVSIQLVQGEKDAKPKWSVNTYGTVAPEPKAETITTRAVVEPVKSEEPKKRPF